MPAAPASSASTSSVFDVQILALTILANCVEINSDARQVLASLTIEGQGGGGDRQQGGSQGDKRRARGTAIPACAFLVQFLMQHAATFADALAREIGDTESDYRADGHTKVLPVSSITSDSDIRGARADFDDAENGGSFDQDDKEDLILCG